MRSVRFSVRSSSIVLPLVLVVFVLTVTFLTLTRVSSASNGLSGTVSSAVTVADATPTPIYGGIIFGRGYFNSIGMFKINTDGTNRINLTDLGSVQAKNYSVSRDTGMIAFQMPSGDHGSKIFVMNWDGSGMRQVSPGTDPSDTTSDFNPSISPDGSKVAFSSTRRRGERVATCIDGAVLTRDYEIWEVNTDGTNFHQATFSEDHYVATGGQGDGCGMGSSTRAAWMADNQHLVVYGTRPYKPQSGDTRLIFPGSLEAWSATGRFGTLYGVNPNSDPTNRDETADDSRKQAVGAVGISGSANGIGWLDVDANNRVLFQAGCCFIPNADGLGFWTPGTLGVGYANRDVLMGSTPADGLGQIFQAQYSPDGSHLAIIGSSPYFNNNHQTTVFIDGYQSPIPGVGGFMQFDYGLAWAPGPPIPNPAKLVLQPNPLWLYNGVRSPVSPSLLDADGNVIARSAIWSSSDLYPSAGFRCDNTADQIPCSGSQLNGLSVDFTGSVLGGGSNAQGNLCEANAGIRTCVPYYNTAGYAFLNVAATQPIALTSGAGGPGVFTISRVPNPPTLDPVIVNFAATGTAQRDLDYTFDFVGNSVTIPSGQTSVDINVRPLRRQLSDRTVVLTLQPNNSSYSIVNANATVTITEPTPTPSPTPTASPTPTVSPTPTASPTPSPSPSPALTIWRVTPNHGGDGGAVTATIFGLNIQQGAAVALSRAGEIDIAGENAGVTAGGSSITALFNLVGRTQGAWDVVVMNPDGGNSRLSAAFTIEPSKEANVWLNLSGRDKIRASHTATAYTISYGNTGNVDAFGVPLIVVGIPKDAEVQLDADIQPIPGQSASDENPAVIKTDTAQGIALILPAVPANSTNYLRFTVRFSGINSNDTFRIRALLFQPLLEPSITSSSFSKNAPLVINSASPQPPTAFKVKSHTAELWYSFISNAISCAVGFTKIGPIEACLRDFANGMLSLLATVVGSHQWGAGLSSVSPFTWWSFCHALAGGFIDCAKAVLGEALNLTPAGFTINVLGCIFSAADFFNTVIQAVQDGWASGDDLLVHRAQSNDPNLKQGPRGMTPQHYISTAQPMPYSIFFENLDTATAPAQVVVVEDQLDPTKVDLSTFRLGLISFGDHVINPPQGSTDYEADVDLRPGVDLIVRIHSGLNQQTGIARWQFTSIDPATNQPVTNPNIGFLPPDGDGIVGQGSVLFSIMPKAGLEIGAQITNKATIVFDLNSPMDTETFVNLIDDSKPQSHVEPLPAQVSATSFPVTWSGSDTGSGIIGYTVYVSTNGGAFVPWLTNTAAMSGTFNGQQGTSYAFYSIARDGAGNVEDKSPTVEASTTTPVPTPTPTPTPTATPTPTPTATPTATPTPSPTPTPTPRSACPQGQGYWKNNPAAWKANSLTLGGKSYTKTELLKILNTSTGSGKKTDASLILADQLIAAKLNLLSGSDPAPVTSFIGQADSLLGAYSGKVPLGVAPSTMSGKAMTSTANALEAYNSGSMTLTCGSVAIIASTTERSWSSSFADIVNFIVIMISTST